MLSEKVVPGIHTLRFEPLQHNIAADVLRLDTIHPVVSGNKWFKLKEYLKEARTLAKEIIITFGGAYSNHIVATAAAAKNFSFKSIAIIRGEQPKVLSHTLQQAMQLGMDIHFISREAYSEKKLPESISQHVSNAYIINEGGYGILGMKGVRDMTHTISFHGYSHVLSAVGTGTTLSGLVEASSPHQQVIGISALKNNFELEEQVNKLVSADKKSLFTILHHYHFGGYAKYSPELTRFMNEWYTQTGIPSDFVYTGKLFYAFAHLCKQSFFAAGSKVLLVHSGGLQGNRSLEKGTLIF